MSGLKRLIHQIHQRSLWQVLAIYLGGAWVAYEAIQGLTEGLGLPEWFPGLAVVLFIIGLPIVLATAFVQEKEPGVSPDAGAAFVRAAPPPETETAATATGDARPGEVEPSEARAGSERTGIRRFLTWRISLLTGVAVFALWGVASAAWLLFTVPGLVVKAEAADFFHERDRVVVAAFENQTDQPALDLAVREAIITDLAGSEYVDVLDPTEIDEALEHMRLPDTTRLSERVAIEIARRGGRPAVIAGSVTPLGSGYQLSARVIEASSGEVAVRVRETAADDAEVVSSVEKLSRLLRRHLGERLTSLQRSPPLPQVTTGSLEALELYARATDYGNRGDLDSAIPLLEQAVSLDTAFATAYRALSIYHSQVGNTGPAQRYADLAYAHVDRLVSRERYLVGALYHSFRYRLDSAAYYYELQIERDSTSLVALNNLGDAYEWMGRYEDAGVYYRRARQLDPDRPTPWFNIASIARTLGDTATADSALAHLQAEFPEAFNTRTATIANRVYAGDFETATARAAELAAHPSPVFSGWGHQALASLAALRGDVKATLAHTDTVIRLASETGLDLLAYVGLEELQYALLGAGSPQRALPYLRRVEDFTEEETAPFLGAHGLGIVAEGYALIGELENAERAVERLDSLTHAADMHPLGLAEHVRGIIALQENRLEDAIGHLRRARDHNWGRMPRTTRLLLADAEAARGRLDVAAAHYDSLTRSYRLHWTEAYVYGPTLPLAHERAANTYLQLGDTVSAVRHLSAFVQLWRNADPELQGRVLAASRRLERLAGGR